MSLLVTGSVRHPLSDRGHDLYETPAEAVTALLRAVPVPRRLWEPACGPGAMVRVLRAAGHDVVATDLVDYGCPESAGCRDFLAERSPPNNAQAIVTNPPFKAAEKFVTHALDLAPQVFMLLRLAFLESERRRTLLDRGDLVAVLPFRNRLPMMHRHGWAGPKASSATPFAWFWWRRGHGLPAYIQRISWEPAQS